MKMLTVELVEELENSLIWITGRCCRDDIRVGDILFHDSSRDIKVVVEEIEVYQKKREMLAHGYVGGVIVRVIDGGTLPCSGFLVDGNKENIQDQSCTK